MMPSKATSFGECRDTFYWEVRMLLGKIPYMYWCECGSIGIGDRLGVRPCIASLRCCSWIILMGKVMPVSYGGGLGPVGEATFEMVRLP